MDYQQDVARLEGIIEKLMNGIDFLRKENTKLKNNLVEREAELASLKSEREALQDERSSIHQRVSSILGTIEEWEKTVDLNGPAEADDGGGQLELNMGEN